MNEMLDAQNSLYGAMFVSCEEFYSESCLHPIGNLTSDSSLDIANSSSDNKLQ